MNNSKAITTFANNPAPPIDGSEMLCDRLRRLSHEISEALSEWSNGQFMAMIYPSDHPMGVHYRSIGSTPESRLAYAAEAYQQAARAVDPSATVWWELRSPDPGIKQRFLLIGARADEVTQ